NTQRNLGKAIRVSLKDGPGPVTVKLEPCATIKGRLLDKDGEPLRGGRIRFDLPEKDYLIQLEQAATDLDGRFNKSDVLPGCDYNVECESATFDVVAKNLNVSSGETIDLGEFDVTDKDRPKPKRTIAETKTAQPTGMESAIPHSTAADSVVPKDEM